MTSRLEREKDFHNKAFSEGTRESTARFYAIDRKSSEFYRGFLSECPPGKNALEYGCGPGSSAFRLAKQGLDVVGIDISDVAVEQATRRAEAEGVADRAVFRVMDAEALQFEDGHFDVICGTGILHHLVLDRAYAELARVLDPAGRAVFVEPLAHNPLINLYRRVTPGLRTEDEHPLKMADLGHAEHYFGSVGARYFHLQSLLAVPLRGWKRFEQLAAALGRADDALFRRVPAARRYAWMVALTLSKPLPRAGRL